MDQSGVLQFIKRQEWPMVRSAGDIYRPHPKDEGGNIFSLSTLARGGDPIPRSGQGRVPPSQVRMGSPHPPPHLGGVPGQDWGRTVPWDWMGLPPPPGRETEQHSEHLLHSGRYASCVHAGGLSCHLCIQIKFEPCNK